MFFYIYTYITMNFLGMNNLSILTMMRRNYVLDVFEILRIDIVLLRKDV